MLKVSVLSIAVLVVLATPALAERIDCRFNPQYRGCQDKIKTPAHKSDRKSASRASNPDTPDTPNPPNNPDPPGNPNTPDPPSNSNQGRNNGFGNGDQDPPGNSGPHNNAENSQHNDRGNSSNAPGHNK